MTKGVLRVNADRFAIFDNGPVQIMFESQCVAEAGMRLDEIGVETHRFPQFNNGPIHVALQTEIETEVPVCFGQIRIDA